MNIELLDKIGEIEREIQEVLNPKHFPTKLSDIPLKISPLVEKVRKLAQYVKLDPSKPVQYSDDREDIKKQLSSFLLPSKDIPQSVPVQKLEKQDIKPSEAATRVANVLNLVQKMHTTCDEERKVWEQKGKVDREDMKTEDESLHLQYDTSKHLPSLESLADVSNHDISQLAPFLLRISEGRDSVAYSTPRSTLAEYCKVHSKLCKECANGLSGRIKSHPHSDLGEYDGRTEELTSFYTSLIPPTSHVYTPHDEESMLRGRDALTGCGSVSVQADGAELPLFITDEQH
ncbi:hypothetical protein ADUPG1_010359 [Aduncisulcus paluster]|uniref:Uncharacterized protein n=1 Tax=Aduncisulcus paluster TaxID=2918883 RepID=A0ABQ5JRS6_9EUKA|nr:hypothetical protein ADUPG1_010359 [Aduncisulcus paluster]